MAAVKRLIINVISYSYQISWQNSCQDAAFNNFSAYFPRVGRLVSPLTLAVHERGMSRP